MNFKSSLGINWIWAYCLSILLHLGVFGMGMVIMAKTWHPSSLTVVEIVGGGVQGERGNSTFPAPLSKSVMVAKVKNVFTPAATLSQEKEPEVKPVVRTQTAVSADSSLAVPPSVSSVPVSRGSSWSSADQHEGGIAGTAGTKGAPGTGVAGKVNSHGLGAGFVDNGDGTYTANVNATLSYRIIRDAQVTYPEEARNIGYAKTVVLHAKILVGITGKVEAVHITSSVPNLGFKEAAESALWNMRFAPIVYKGYKIKMYFQKTIYFQP
ncbi:energy transducer TonB [uncultured Megasphaera sp.]|uniref:energy transducer TonB n=1 Tax=uncultured Megasphaera sp. TaxID=165188 RepID=UPI00288B4850|nr:energy transducer TonB [uncultured Megasphaera sp.]